MPAAWVFDLDGTLTRPTHDYAALRRTLGLPDDLGVIEGLHRLSDGPRAEAEEALAAWEWAHARQATPAPGAQALVEAVMAAGLPVGIVTRNRLDVALHTLEVLGLAGHLHAEDVLGRDCTEPKPSPAGVARLLSRWGVAPGGAVMVGDHLHDLLAGRSAGTRTVLVRAEAPAAWRPHADRHVPHLDALHAWWRAGAAW
ncbi:MAG: HAD family hydrolase [Alphaproteobacteria bacterium]|nr:HAD family hydrolase [Alphaproteobacteria bacterium]